MARFFNRTNVRTVVFLKNVVSVEGDVTVPGRAPRGVGGISVALRAPYIPSTPVSVDERWGCRKIEIFCDTVSFLAGQMS